MSEIWSVAQESPVSAALVLLQLACFLGFGVLLAKQDMATHRLPNRLVASWLAASLAVIALLGIFRSDLHGVLIGLLGLLLLGGGYLLLTLASGGAMGMGDVKLAGVLGLNLGYYSLPSLFFATLLAFVLATLWVIGGVVARKLTLKSAVPFGPFMLIGSFIALLMAR
ncbi:prepilin peptidase [Glutamicibacter arilaitensis]|uniref:Prepilin peptidase n=2 Tax=Glutamicibacter arilaitensis TaxID=256701 RepID=A0A2N7S6Q0_9MICC|nr:MULTISPECIES: A24 family peptidase [Glutamicibacter]CBT74980.1 putative leader peptidase [Glutamicibacter arilaitensis Re117]PMQ21822.1 prepilin peptidase [Glutamicibacter arilaitensis]HCH49049.1 prepilin peptidase [Glutamicibacter sp.]HCJ54650.1 prepilin peptidase [Glutamicibacter sp.]HCM93465.1 prepilin peptidase [Glutamicibacter sp.]